MMTIRQFLRILPLLAAVFGLITVAPEALAAKSAEKKTAHASKTPAKTSKAKKASSAQKTRSKKTATRKSSAKASDATADDDSTTPTCKTTSPRHKGRGKGARKSTACTASKTASEPRSDRTADALRSQTDDFVSIINTGQQSLLDAKIAWGAKHPEIACQRAQSAKAQFAKARTKLDGMVKTAEAGKGDTAPLKALYPKTDELDASTRDLIAQTCVAGN